MLNIQFTGHQMEVTPALKAIAEEKLDKLDRHFDRITGVHVVFNVEKLSQIVEATVHVAHGELHARAESENMYSALDELIDKLDRQLIKHKEKMRDHRE